MTTEREMLEYAAKACGRGDKWWCGDQGRLKWNPLTNSADCAAMCAKLMLDSDWYADSIRVERTADLDWDTYESWAEFKDHNNDREAAWRYAATMVAAKIGGMK